MLIAMVQFPASYLIPSPRYLHVLEQECCFCQFAKCAIFQCKNIPSTLCTSTVKFVQLKRESTLHPAPPKIWNVHVVMSLAGNSPLYDRYNHLLSELCPGRSTNTISYPPQSHGRNSSPLGGHMHSQRPNISIVNG